jgi:hypothetical protein
MESVLNCLLVVGVAVTWVMSTATLAVSAVTLYLISNCRNQKKRT